MALSPFKRPGKDEVNLNAVREQAAMLRCLYSDDQAGVRKVAQIGGDAALLAWFQTPEDGASPLRKLPNYGLVQTPEAYWIIIGGTTTAEQWAGNGMGFLLRDDFLGSGTECHSYFEGVASTIYEDLKRFLPADLAGKRINVSGHSLGGGAGELLACMVKKDAPTADVGCMTFGSPRALLAGYGGPKPDVHYRIVHGRDFITHLPPASSGFGNFFLSAAAPQIGRYAAWQHYGTPVYLNAQGVVSDTPPEGYGLAEKKTWQSAPFGDHSITKYGNAAFAAGRRYGSGPNTPALESAWAEITGQPASTPQVELGDQTQYLIPATTNRVIFQGKPAATAANWRSFAGTALTAEASFVPTEGNFPAKGSAMADWKCSLIFSFGRNGWTETYYLKQMPETPNASHDWMKELGKRRVAMLGKGAKLDAIRVSHLNQPQRADLAFGADLGIQTNGVGTDLANPWSALWFTTRNGSKTKKAMHKLRGFPMGAIGTNTEGTQASGSVNGAYKNELAAFFRALKGMSGETGSPTIGPFCIPSTSPVQNTVQLVTGVTVDEETGRYQITVSSVNSYEVGDKVTIKGARGKGIKGLSGKATIIARTQDGKTYTIDKRSCEDCLILLKTYPTVFKKESALETIVYAGESRWAGVRTGSAFFRSPGRSKGQGCC